MSYCRDDSPGDSATEDSPTVTAGAQDLKQRGGNLPADVTSFVGRRTDIATLRAQLGESRLITLTGVGGVGKTRIALRLAAESQRAFPDGAWFVQLAALQDDSLVADTVATTLGLDNHTSRTALSELSRQMADRRLLLILDNCEHLSTACAALVDQLLRAAPMLRVVVTSRHSLGVLGEHIFTVPPLSTPASGPRYDTSALEQFDSVALLRARASNSTAGFEVTAENGESVARLCERLDGIPLAIELAAARLRTLSVGEVLERLDRRFQLLTAGNDAALPRHQTLAALIDWSYALCSAAEKSLWGRLSVFAGSFTLAAAEAVCAGDGVEVADVVDLVDSLVRKSILIVERTGEATRYRLLETLREYGRDRLVQTARASHWQMAHLDYFLRLADQSFGEWCGPDQARWLARLRDEHTNLRAAFDRCLELGLTERACSLAAALQWFWIAGGNLGEGRLWMDQALTAAARQEPSGAHADAMWVDAFLALLQGDLSSAEKRLDEADKFASSTLAPRLSGYIAQLRGMSALFAGELDKARAHYEAAMASHVEHGDDAGALAMLFQLAVVCVFTGDHDTAASLCERSLRLSADFGERWAITYASWALGVNKWSQGDYTGAAELARAGLPVTLEFNDRLGMVHLVELLCWSSASDGRHAESARLLGTARAGWDQLGTSMQAFGGYLHNCEIATEARLRAALSSREFDALLAEGAASSLEAVAADVTGGAARPSARRHKSESPLSARELEVAALVARGLTNREIAAELVLSSRTIDSHVQHILEKLNFGSRAQIAGWFAARP